MPDIEHEVVTCHVLKYDKTLPLGMVNGYILYLYNYLINRENIILGSKRFFTVFLGIMINLLDSNSGPRIVTLVSKSGGKYVWECGREEKWNKEKKTCKGKNDNDDKYADYLYMKEQRIFYCYFVWNLKN